MTTHDTPEAALFAEARVALVEVAKAETWGQVPTGTTAVLKREIDRLAGRAEECCSSCEDYSGHRFEEDEDQ